MMVASMASKVTGEAELHAITAMTGVVQPAAERPVLPSWETTRGSSA